MRQKTSRENPATVAPIAKTTTGSYLVRKNMPAISVSFQKWVSIRTMSSCFLSDYDGYQATLRAQ